MTPLRFKLGLGVPLLALAFLCGCPQKKPVQAAAPVPPPEASPTPVASETPAPQPEQNVQPPAQATQEPEQAAVTEKKPEKKPLHRLHPAKKPAQEKPAVQEARNALPPKPDATTSPATIAPAPAKADPGRDQAATDQLLQTAQTNLNNIKRDLSQDEKDMVTQIKAFITQSREASKNNDQVRAYNLANKARLLSDALVKP